MPRAFDPAERTRIAAALRDVGLRHFTRSGLRAARVDDICRDVGIAKGSFYAFFPGKEELFMAIVAEREAQHRQDMYRFITAAAGTPADRAGGFFDLIVTKIEGDPVLNILMANGELQYLLRRLGPERFAKAQADDMIFAEEAARLWQRTGVDPISSEDLLSLMTLCFSLVVQRQHMTGGQYHSALALLRETFIARLSGRTA